MKSMKWMIVGSLAVAMVAVGCKKETSGGGTVPVTQNPLRQIFNDNVENAKQTFTVQANTGGQVQGQDGVTAFFAPNAFMRQNGTVATGAVQVELIEALNVADMVWLNKQTLGNDNGQLKPLISGGQYYMNATQNGEQLWLATGSTTVLVPAPNGVDPNMELFIGEVDQDGEILWDPFANGDMEFDSSAFVIGEDTLDWVNCDYFMNGGIQTSVQVTCPSGHTENNTFVWLVFPDQNAMTAIHNTSGSVFSTGSYYTLPVGMNMIVIALSQINGVVSSSFTSTSVSANMNQTIQLSPTTLAEFQSDLGNM